jgi:hypothetical protein
MKNKNRSIKKGRNRRIEKNFLGPDHNGGKKDWEEVEKGQI